MRAVYRVHGAVAANLDEAASESTATGRVNQVYLLGEIAVAFAARGKTMMTVDCSRCPRRGRLSLQCLLAEHGPLMRGPDVLNAIAADCDKQGTEERMTSAGCAAWRWSRYSTGGRSTPPVPKPCFDLPNNLR